MIRYLESGVRLIAGLTVLAASASAYALSAEAFDCAKARTPTETAICADPVHRIADDTFGLEQVRDVAGQKDWIVP